VIGFVRVSEIPKLVIAIVIGIMFLLIVGSLVQHFPWILDWLQDKVQEDVLKVLFAVCMIAFIGGCYASGNYLWERIRRG
jgi:hypothetical protein